MPPFPNFNVVYGRLFQTTDQIDLLLNGIRAHEVFSERFARLVDSKANSIRVQFLDLK